MSQFVQVKCSNWAPVVVKASTCALTVNKVLHRVHYTALTAYSMKKLKPAVMYRSCKMKWNHILFLWFRFASTHLTGSHEIHATKKKKKERLARFHFVPSWAKYPPRQNGFHAGHHPTSCNIIEMNRSSRKLPK